MTTPYTIIIPSRYASTRLPGKPLLDINGKPLLQHVYEDALTSSAKRVIIATDDQRIFDFSTSIGAEVVMTSDAHASGTDRIAEVITKQNIADDTIIVNLQGDEYRLPTILTDQVADALYESTSASVSTLCEVITDKDDINNPNVVKVMFDKNGLAINFSRSLIPYPRQETTCNVYRHIGLYAYRAGYLKQLTALPACEYELTECLEQLRVLYNSDKIRVSIASAESGVGIDTPEDLERARAI